MEIVQINVHSQCTFTFILSDSISSYEKAFAVPGNQSHGNVNIMGGILSLSNYENKLNY